MRGHDVNVDTMNKMSSLSCRLHYLLSDSQNRVQQCWENAVQWPTDLVKTQHHRVCHILLLRQLQSIMQEIWTFKTLHFQTLFLSSVSSSVWSSVFVQCFVQCVCAPAMLVLQAGIFLLLLLLSRNVPCKYSSYFTPHARAILTVCI